MAVASNRSFSASVSGKFLDSPVFQRTVPALENANARIAEAANRSRPAVVKTASLQQTCIAGRQAIASGDRQTIGPLHAGPIDGIGSGRIVIARICGRLIWSGLQNQSVGGVPSADERIEYAIDVRAIFLTTPERNFDVCGSRQRWRRV
jgi:hypothetical protein